MLYTTPSPQRKKEPSRENKLRLFLSEPLMTLQNSTEKVPPINNYECTYYTAKWRHLWGFSHNWVFEREVNNV